MRATATSNVTHEPSASARARILSRRGEPLFIASWTGVLMIHFEVEAGALQRDVPFELDLWNNRAFVTLVAFTMRGLRPRVGGKLAALLCRPIATHDFLNVRTYVRHGGERGIHFIAEWLTNCLAVMLGPSTFGLPYHYGSISYNRDLQCRSVSGRVLDIKNNAPLAFNAKLDTGAAYQPCATGSLDEWLMERYTAFNSAAGRPKYFRVWHPPWRQCPAHATITDPSLLTRRWKWFDEARLASANFSPGIDEVWMGRPHRVSK